MVKLPAGLSAKDGAASMLQGLTAHYLVKSSYPLKKGDTCLVHAAAGGMGLLLCQMGKMLGATVIGTVSTEEKAALAKSAGADHVILYSRQDFEPEVKSITGGRGVDVVYDGVGASTFDKSLNCLRPRGFMILFGASSGPVPPLDLQIINVRGSLFLQRPSLTHHIATREELLQRAGDVHGWIRDGKIKLRIEHQFPLAQAAEAHKALEGRKTTGKILLIP
jgi:NADPH:quinone reductase